MSTSKVFCALFACWLDNVATIGSVIHCVPKTYHSKPEFTLRHCIFGHPLGEMVTVSPESMSVNQDIHFTKVVKHSALFPDTPEFTVVIKQLLIKFLGIIVQPMEHG